MRMPLLVLIITFSIAILGFVLIPGIDEQGNPWRMDFFYAFYFVSYMSTTIGFGEIPYAFTDAQRLWVTITIFSTVIVWLYSIGKMINLLQDKVFQQAVTERRFARQIKKLRDNFYLICGYGETGSALVATLSDRGQHAVVLDINEQRIQVLKLENLPQYVPGFCADASKPIHLIEAGLQHPLCQGVVALTNENDVNLHIAITSRLLHPELKVICRADSHDTAANMASFGTDYIVDPFDTFALHLATAMQSPGLYLLTEWLTGQTHQLLSDPLYPPKHGHWVVCGFGRFGKAIYQQLKKLNITMIIIEAMPEQTQAPFDTIKGRGTEANTLLEGKIGDAVGIIAGTDNDMNNLSIIMTARELNPHLFVIIRQNQQSNDTIVNAIHADIVMHPSYIIANRIRLLLSTPLLARFLSISKNQTDQWACEVISRIVAVSNDMFPEIWEVVFNIEDTPAVYHAIKSGSSVKLADILSDPNDRERQLPCIPLLLYHGMSYQILPDEDISLKLDDKILFCGAYYAHFRMQWSLQNEHALTYLITGSSPPQGVIWKMIRKYH